MNAPSQQSYLQDISAIKPQPSAVANGPEAEDESGEIANLTQEGTALIKPEMVETEKTILPREKIVYYEVMPGDTVSTIAQQFDISVNTVLWENNLNAYSLIRPGDKLAILPMSGITHKVAKGDTLSSISKTYDIDQKDIMEANQISDPSQISVSEILLIPGGKKQSYASSQAKTTSGYNIIKDIIVNQISKPKSATPTGNKMQWPTVGSRITQYYSWRHAAIDIANKTGTPIYAADAGTVEYVGWGSGYGNEIIINHGGGKKTRYAHLSKFYCKTGDKVSKGETIGAMGSTGWSTGPHLHFEVIINGTKYNPLNYVR
jgi:LysM repeat protein